MQQRLNATKHPRWVQLAVQLALWVALALMAPFFVGVIFDILTGLSPLGLLLGVALGMLSALLIILRTIQNRLLMLAPLADVENAEEKS